ncbi:hypothetical protein PNA2_1960 [Pyrococcus sp. NA2]|uniref:hypothetical protein n=1 Tax=Pyrococcus sp. (strain NA2) TaxID=342949 RepID=UPI000209AE2E|nr:hypothetical protein [Pyrococcus sp. NA2]AEC52874.1 hypothetical protein PNA2_1960 [Pyrococcus sp. NA2]
MRLIRFGPTILHVEEGWEKIIALGFGEVMDVHKAFEKSGELDTVFINSEEAILSRTLPWVILSKLIEAEGIVIRPRGVIILFRTPDPEEIKKALLEKFRGKETDVLEAILTSDSSETVIMLTKKPLTRPIRLEDIERTLILSEDVHTIYKALLLEGPAMLLNLIPEWNDIVIKLYDQTGHYLENIERISIVVEDLELGYITGAGWGWDYPRPMLKVPVYRMRLISWEDPKRIKFLLKGLEYLGYRRLCDIDVEVKGKKVSWFEIGNFKSKFELAREARKELERLLSVDALSELKEIEERLAKTI